MKRLLSVSIIILLLAAAFLLQASGLTQLPGAVRFAFMDKSGLVLTMSPVDPAVKVLTADPANRLLFKAVVRETDGGTVSGVRINTKVTQGPGSFVPLAFQTGADGSVILQFTPPPLDADAFKDGNPKITVSAGIQGAAEGPEFSFELTRVPVIFVPGYKASPDIFSSMKAFLEGEGFVTEGFSYDSDKGVASGAAELGTFIDKIKAGLLEKGVQAARFDIVAHSMGGLVARYYTCDGGYAERNDVRKLIFVSVPQAGSPVASLGLKYYSGQGIEDLVPESPIYKDVFPSLINRGLNDSVQTGSILGQYDEVVSPESASLEEWGIETELFDVGESNLTLDNLLSGKIVEAANHKMVLYNGKVFRRIEEMLYSDLPYPAKRR